MDRCKISVCRGSTPIFKPGEQVLVQLQVLDGLEPFRRLADCRVEIALSTPRQKPMRFGYAAGGGSKTVVVDKEGYLAFVVEEEETSRMCGVYIAEVSVVERGVRLVSESFEVFEVVKKQK